MNAVEYLNQSKRMCESYSNKCDYCGIFIVKGYGASCHWWTTNYPKQAIAIVEQWAKEHPVKTYLSVLLEKFPNNNICPHSFPSFCVEEVYGTRAGMNCNKLQVQCMKCWNREYKEEN